MGAVVHRGPMPGESRQLRELSERECVRALHGARVGRVVFTDHGLPAVLPLTYVLRDSAVLMATAAGSRLARAADGGVLAFEIDDVDAVTETGWSVVVTGVAEVMTQADYAQAVAARGKPVDEGEAMPVRPWAPGRDALLIRLPCTQLTGRAITLDPAHVPDVWTRL